MWSARNKISSLPQCIGILQEGYLPYVYIRTWWPPRKKRTGWRHRFPWRSWKWNPWMKRRKPRRCYKSLITGETTDHKCAWFWTSTASHFTNKYVNMFQASPFTYHGNTPPLCLWALARNHPGAVSLRFVVVVSRKETSQQWSRSLWVFFFSVWGEKKFLGISCDNSHHYKSDF